VISNRICALLAVTLLVGTGCDDDETTPAPSGGGGGGGDGGTSGATPPAGGSKGAAIASCPASSSIIQNTEWVSCVAGKTIAGKEPFNNQPCEIRFGENGRIEYVRGGAVALTVPERGSWTSANGTYQYTQAPNPIFLAGLSLSYTVPEGEPRVTNVNLRFMPAGMEDDVEVVFLDAARNRQTYTCKVDVL